ncbi:hypothetical protein CC80DRAFT_229354 [Byssothecium circinans]|uniref:Secreted protein n=1 Tax=Byssothecium circinans TaxID=147558 RepID=A0A6A5UAU2_9PLEO|nr:hypothetical protein CC80DRAFT_229354 [Byssothecium circinans]
MFSPATATVVAVIVVRLPARAVVESKADTPQGTRRQTPDARLLPNQRTKTSAAFARLLRIVHITHQQAPPHL